MTKGTLQMGIILNRERESMEYDLQEVIEKLNYYNDINNQCVTHLQIELKHRTIKLSEEESKTILAIVKERLERSIAKNKKEFEEL